MRFRDISQIIDWFNDEGCPNYIIWTKDGICGKGTFKEMDEAEKKLQKDLDRLTEDEYGTHYTVSVSDSPIKADTKKKDLVYCTYISPAQKKESNSENGFTGGNAWLYQELKATQEKLQSAQDEILRLRMEQEADDDEEIEEQAQPNILSGLMSNPQVQTAIAGMLAGMMGSNAPAQPQAMAGVGDDDIATIKAALRILRKHDPKLPQHLTYLANMAENDNEQFQFLIKMMG